MVLVCVEADWSGSWFEMAVLGCRSLVLVNNQVLRKIKIAVKSDVKTGHIWVLGNEVLGK